MQKVLGFDRTEASILTSVFFITIRGRRTRKPPPHPQPQTRLDAILDPPRADRTNILRGVGADQAPRCTATRSASLWAAGSAMAARLCDGDRATAGRCRLVSETRAPAPGILGLRRGGAGVDPVDFRGIPREAVPVVSVVSAVPAVPWRPAGTVPSWPGQSQALQGCGKGAASRRRPRRGNSLRTVRGGGGG